jgi:hypothetical protein
LLELVWGQLLDQLTELIGWAKVTGLAKLLDQLTELIGWVKVTGLAKLLDQLAKLAEVAEPDGPAKRAELAELTRLVGLNRLEPQTLLLVQRVTGLVLEHRTPRHGNQGRDGYRGGSSSPQPRPESLHRVVT